MNQKIDVNKHLKELSENLSEIKKGIPSTDFSTMELKGLKDGLLKAELEAYKIKLDPKIDDLFAHQPQLANPNVIMNLFQHLKPDISKAIIPSLTSYILEKWELKSGKYAA